MPNFYCRHSQENSSVNHHPYAGELVVAATKLAAAQAFAVLRNLGANPVILVSDEPEAFQAGQVISTTLPAYT